ncbi:MAG: acyl-CoA thioester hydrolase [Solirubrobacteraceae bacterium]|nr:acyl-CoA thioester hydrolase [Solirubrobacteraceae bacterium]
MTHRVALRWVDLDGLGHVWHGNVMSYFEEGRDAFFATCGIGRRDYVVGRCEINYRREIRLEQGHLDVECEIAELGTKSVTTRERLLAPDGEVLVEASFGLVLWDAERRVTRPITGPEREALAA